MVRSIERVRAGHVSRGEFIIDVDDESLETASEITEAYDPDEQDWQHVVGIKGHADVGQFVLAMHNGELWTTGSSSWDGYVWRLVENGEPVVQDPTEDD